MRFSTVALGVSDLLVAERFYVQGLGFAVDSRPQADLVYLASGETRIALYPADRLAEYVGAKTRAPGGVVLSLNLSSEAEVDSSMQHALAHGGTGLREPGTMDWGGYAATLKDPDGHMWELVCAAGAG